MIRKLFGETEEEQFKYLKPRMIALGIGVVAFLLGVLLEKIGVPFANVFGVTGEGIIVILMLILGWSIIRGLFGFVTVGSLFSYNIMIGILILIIFLLVGYFAGFFVAIIGLCRFLVLLKKRKGKN